MNEEKIFLGNTPARTRKFLLSTLHQLHSMRRHFVLPCCGQLSAAVLALTAGWKPEQIIASDVSLFSTVLARSVNGESLKGLGIRIDGKKAPDDSAVEVLYQIKLLTARAHARHYYQDIQIDDIVRRKPVHMKAIESSLQQFKSLAGFTYRLRDLFDETAEAMDGDNVIWVNPPGYYRGYAKMFNTNGHITWNEPQYAEFRPNEGHNRLREMAIGKPGILLWYRYKAIEPEDESFAVFAERKGKDRYDYTLCSQPDLLALKGKSDCKCQRNVYRHQVLLAAHRITPSSHIRMIRVSEHMGLYYRDLFVHQLANTMAQLYYVLLIDGFVAGVVGTMVKQAYDNNLTSPFEGHVEEVFGMTAYSEVHPKLNRLLMMLIKSDEFLNQYDSPVFRATGIVTTCLSQHAELKINRGIYKLTDRKKMSNGQYKLRYRADRTQQTYQEVLVEWLTKYS